MPLWNPEKEWLNQDAYIIGGGPSLSGFNWDTLKGLNTIGCNDAFRLGAGVVKVCLFGDASFFHRSKWDLEKIQALGGMRIVSCAPQIMNIRCPWLFQLERIKDGLYGGSTVGWNYSTGASAINLAVILGASRIFLLGYDLKLGPVSRSHWHTYTKRTINPGSFKRFLRGFGVVAEILRKKYPLVKVFNVNNGSSLLPEWPQISFAEMERMKIPHEYYPQDEEAKGRLLETVDA